MIVPGDVAEEWAQKTGKIEVDRAEDVHEGEPSNGHRQIVDMTDPTNRPVSYLYLVIICWNEAPGSGRNGRRNRWTDLTEISSCFKNITK